MATNRNNHQRAPANQRYRAPPNPPTGGNVPNQPSSARRPVGHYENAHQGNRNPNELHDIASYHPDMQRYHHADR
jgi:hypothetical protein